MARSTRRDFLKGAAAAGLSLAMGCQARKDGARKDGARKDGEVTDGDPDSESGQEDGNIDTGDQPEEDGGIDTETSLNQGSFYDCIVVGSGAAGLSAAYKIFLAGHKNLKVFEKYPSLGGICGAAEEHGYRFPMGTTYIAMPWTGSAVSQLYQALKRGTGKDWYTTIPEPFDSMYHNGKVTVDATAFGNWSKLPGISKKQSADCAAFRDWFLRVYAEEDLCEWPLWKNKNEALEKYELMTAKTLLNTIVKNPDPWVIGCLESFNRGVLNGSLDEVSALQAIDMFGDEYLSWSELGITENIVGGDSYVVADLMDAIVNAIGKERVAVNSEVLKVENVGDEVEVTVKEGADVYLHRCKYCVVATNAKAARKLVQNIPSGVAAVLDSISYGEYSVVNLVMKNHTVGIGAYDCTLGQNIIDDIYDFTFISKMKNSVPLDVAPQVLGCYIAAENKDDHRPTMPKDDLIKLCLEQLDTMFGVGTQDKVTSTHIRQYKQGMPIMHPGLTFQQETQLMPLFNQRIILAGDYVQGSPTIEGAVESGWYAGGRIGAKL